jgi:hypothetical protein
MRSRFFKHLRQSNTDHPFSAIQGWRRIFVSVALGFNFFAVAHEAVAQALSPNDGASSRPSPPSSSSSGAAALQGSAGKSIDGALRLNQVRLRIVFDSRLFDANSEKERLEQLATFCRVWQEAFLREKGPWGFGIASEVSCNISTAGSVAEPAVKDTFDSWTLTVEKTTLLSKDVIQARLCRPHLASSEAAAKSTGELEQRCEAKKSFPWSNFRLRFVRHRAFVRLLVASLYDQLPLYSLLSRNLVRFDKLRVEGFPEPSTTEVTYPPPPQNLIFVEARFDPNENRFRLREMSEKEAIQLTLSQAGIVWIVSRDGRGARNDEFSRNIESAFITLSSIFQVDQLKYEKKAVESIANKLIDRASTNFFLRADGVYALPLLSQQSGFGASATLGWRNRSKYIVSLSSHYLSSRYRVGTEVVEKDSVGASTGTADVSLKELEGWLAGRYIYPLRLGKSTLLEISGGGRIGYISGSGDFKAPGGLPGENLTLKGRSVGVGALLGIGSVIFSDFQLANVSSVDYALATRSMSIKSAIELSWILSRIVVPKLPERPPGFQIGLAAGFASLTRRFENNDVSRSYNTDVTLNGIQTSLFLERAF